MGKDVYDNIMVNHDLNWNINNLLWCKEKSFECFAEYLKFVKAIRGVDFVFNDIVRVFEHALAYKFFEVTGVLYKPRRGKENFSRREIQIINHTEGKRWILTIGYFFDEENCTDEDIKKCWDRIPYCVEFIELSKCDLSDWCRIQRGISSVPEDQWRNKRIEQK